jgi:hypothetical protein
MARLTGSLKHTSAQLSANRPGRKFNWLKLCLGLLALISLSACVTLQDPETSQDNRGQVVATLEPGVVVEQQFSTRRPDLNQIIIWLKVEKQSESPTDRLMIELLPDRADATPLITVSYRLDSLKGTSSLMIPLAKKNEVIPAGVFRLRMRTEGGFVQLFGRSEDAYAQGELTINNTPVNADLSFRAGYNYGRVAVGQDLAAWLNQLWLILPLLALTWLPGRVLLRASRQELHLDWGERTAISVGLSLAIVPLVMLWTTTLGLHWSKIAVIAVAGALALGYFLLSWPAIRHFSIQKIKISWPSIAMGLVFVFSLGVRLAMVRDLATPAWVDSVHHSLLARLILEQGRMPASYAPYVQVTTTSYHTGYHSLLATFTWLSGLTLDQAMLILGQFLNALAILAVYLLTTTFTRKPAAGVFASLVAGLMTPMPAYYTSWGRYTQLTGLLILPVAFVFLKNLLDDNPTFLFIPKTFKKNMVPVLLAITALAGLLLVHYRVLAFLAALLAAYLIITWIQAAFSELSLKKIGIDVANLAALGLLTLLITLPWWPVALKSFVIPVAVAPGATRLFSDFSWSYLNTALGKYALGLAGLGLIWSIVQRRSFGLIMVLWVAILFFLANLGALGLPGANLINNTSVAIALFIPTALLSGYLLGWVVDGWEGWIPARWKSFYWATIGMTGVALALVSARSLLPILNPGTILSRQADLPAIEWVAENIPADETILINPFLWGYGLYAGSDGGYWISPLAGRKTFPPAALYNYDFNSDNPQRISANTQKIIDLAADPSALHSFLVDQGIGYVFSGVRGGPISPYLLTTSPLFEQVYNEAGVTVFKVKKPG